MRLRTALTMIGVSLLTPGCQLAWDATTNLAFETCLFTDTMTSKVHYCLRANEAWKAYLSCHNGGDFSPDFEKGFKIGYKELLEGGGDTSAPPAPPMQYWKLKAQSVEGREASKQWSLGYKEGASAAKASGARDLIVVPFNKPTPPLPGHEGPPSGPPLGAPGLAPGATLLPPGGAVPGPQLPLVPESELPAPRPASGTNAPLDSKTGAAKSVTPPNRQGPAVSSTVSQAGPKPAKTSESTSPAIRMLPSLDGHSQSPTKPASATPGSLPGTRLLPRKNPVDVPQLPTLSPSQLPAPALVAPPPNNKTSSIPLLLPQDQRGPTAAVAPQAGRRPATSVDGVPMRSVHSLVSSQPTSGNSAATVAPTAATMRRAESRVELLAPLAASVESTPQHLQGARPAVHLIGRQAESSSNGAPMRPVRSLTSSEASPENAPLRPIRSILSPEPHSQAVPERPMRPLSPPAPSTSSLPAPAAGLPVSRLPLDRGTTNQPAPPTFGRNGLPPSIVECPTNPIPVSVGGARTERETRVTPASLAYGVGMAALRGGDTQTGLCWLQSAVKEDPNYAPAHRALMEYYQNIGDRVQAAAHRARAEMPTP